jgi:hypothetical protein
MIAGAAGAPRGAQRLSGSIPTSSSMASLREALFYAVFWHFSILKFRKIETEKAKIFNRKSRQKI